MLYEEVRNQSGCGALHHEATSEAGNGPPVPGPAVQPGSRFERASYLTNDLPSLASHFFLTSLPLKAPPLHITP